MINLYFKYINLKKYFFYEEFMKNHKLMLDFKHFSLQILNKDLNEKVSIKKEKLILS